MSIEKKIMPPAVNRKVTLSSSTSTSASSPVTLTSIRSTESTTRMDRESYLQKRTFDNITHRKGCPTDKFSAANIRDEDPDTEKSSYASRDECELSSSNSDNGPQGQQEAPHSLYVIQKKGVTQRDSRVSKVSKAYSFEDYWSILDSVVDGCRCISMAGACTTVPTTSFGSGDEEDIVHDDNRQASTAHTPCQPHQGSSCTNKSSPTSSTANMAGCSDVGCSDVFNSSNASILDSSFQQERHDGHRSLKLLRDLERELSDDDDFRPAHRTSACFVLHEKDKVNSIFR